MPRTATTDGPRLPPGPRGPVLWQTAQALTGRRQRGFPRLRDRYGPTFSLRVLPGPQTYVFLSDPVDIKTVFAGDSQEFSGARGNEILRAAMGDGSVMLNDGAAHREIRRYLMPVFSPAAVRGYQAPIRAVARAEVADWRVGQQVCLLDSMSRITLETMLQVVFGVTDGDRLDRLRPRVLRLVEVGPVVALGWMYPRLRPLPPWRGAGANLRAVDGLILEEIAVRRAELAEDAGPRDVLAQLLRVGGESGGQGGAEPAPLSDAKLRDQLVTLVLAGYETSASALAWTLHELARSPEALARAAQAADDDDTGYLEACVKEALRLHPVIDFVARVLTREQTIGGWHLPAGVAVAPAIMLTQLDAQYFPDPHAFRPERFLAKQPAPNTWIPFGGGVRRCVGASFALLEGVIVLQEVLRRFGLVAEAESRTRLRNITNVPADRAPVRLLPR